MHLWVDVWSFEFFFPSVSTLSGVVKRLYDIQVVGKDQIFLPVSVLALLITEEG